LFGGYAEGLGEQGVEPGVNAGERYDRQLRLIIGRVQSRLLVTGKRTMIGINDGF
jgi:hypothetical protein